MQLWRRFRSLPRDEAIAIVLVPVAVALLLWVELIR